MESPISFPGHHEMPKTTTDMIKHTVQYNLDIVIMQILADI